MMEQEKIDPLKDLETAVKEIINRPHPTAEELERMQKESNQKHFGLYMTNDEVLEYWSNKRGESNV